MAVLDATYNATIWLLYLMQSNGCEKNGLPMNVGDVIEHEMVLPSTKTEAWEALTTAEGLSGWWSESVEIDLRPGGAISFDMGGHGLHPARVEAVEPEQRFVMSWRLFQREEGADAVPELTSEVEFRLEDHPMGMLLKLREPGFSALPEALSAMTLYKNEFGWDDDALPRLRCYLKKGARVARQ